MTYDGDRRMQNYKFLNHIVLWNVFFAIICIPTAGKLIDVVGIPLSISIYYFPFVFIFGDILTEVYGYAVARRVFVVLHRGAAFGDCNFRVCHCLSALHGYDKQSILR
jgi:uncharacterized PurR-regulated membrane protein YhhQ (DUF165 family)